MVFEAGHENELLHRSIVESSWDLLAVVSMDGRVEQASPSMLAAFHVPVEALLGSSLASLAVEADRARLDAAFAQTRAGRALGRDVDIQLCLPGGPRLFEARFRPLGEGRDGRVLFNARDIQQERETQAQMLHFQRLAVFGRLAAGFAHEVRNPLAGIVNAAQLAQRRVSAGHDAGEQLQVVLRQAERLRVLMEDVLLHAKGSRMAPSWVDPALVMQKALETALQQYGPHRKNISTAFHCEPGVLRIHVTEERLQRLLHNLILNALQAFSAEGGQLTLTTCRQGTEALLRVQDDGPGLPGDLAQRAFEPFVTTKATGSGLGLWIAQSLSQEMGGRLQYRPADPRGALFELRLPQAEGRRA